MKDLTVELADRPGSLAAMGTTLGERGVSVEGGGVFVHGGVGVAHFLVADGDAAPAVAALAAAGIAVGPVREVLVQRLRQDVPGQLGAICTLLAEAGVNIEVQYSDHDNQLVLVVDDVTAGRRISDEWSRTLNS